MTMQPGQIRVKPSATKPQQGKSAGGARSVQIVHEHYTVAINLKLLRWDLDVGEEVRTRQREDLSAQRT